MRSTLLRGEVLHARADRHAHRVFRYPVCCALIEPSELPLLHEQLFLFSLNRFNAFSLDRRDYDSLDVSSLRAANGLPAAASELLVTNLRTFGYTFNPVSFFLGYDAGGSLGSAVAEVNNTYGGRHRYLLGGERGYRHTRELFVSPFLHGPATYDFDFDVPLDGPSARIEMRVTQDERRTFTARLTGTRVPLTDRALAAAMIRYPLMAVQVIALIHLEALKLHARRVPYRASPPGHRPLGGYEQARPILR
jgi:hypothetical protein